MKLSEKGKERLSALGFTFDCDGAFDLLDDYEFEPDDFEGAAGLLRVVRQGLQNLERCFERKVRPD